MNTQTSRFFPGARALLLAACVAGTTFEAAADGSFRMQVHPNETSGTRAIEHDNYREAIARLEIERARSDSRAERWSAVIGNLCVAYARSGEYGRAASYCDAAVEAETELGIALNNRGVLAALMGDFAAASTYFEAARERTGSREFADHNIRRLGELISEYQGDDPSSNVVEATS